MRLLKNLYRKIRGKPKKTKIDLNHYLNDNSYSSKYNYPTIWVERLSDSDWEYDTFVGQNNISNNLNNYFVQSN